MALRSTFYIAKCALYTGDHETQGSESKTHI